MTLKERLNHNLYLFPILGILLYVCLYSVADYLYAQSLDNFSFEENLLCDMMQEESNKGHYNQGRPIAIIGHVFLSIGMTSFFYLIPRIFTNKNFNTKAFQILSGNSGIDSFSYRIYETRDRCT